VIIGPYASRDEAKKETNRLQRLIKVKGFVVDLSTITY
jgi:cell division septation protein DedD